MELATRIGRRAEGTHAVLEGAETCRCVRAYAETGFLRISRHFGSLRRVPTHSRSTMVRKGSPVRVRQRALKTALQRGLLVSGAARMTTSERFLARRGQAWPLIGAARWLFRLAAASRLEAKVPTRYTPGRKHSPRSAVCSLRWAPGRVRELSFSDADESDDGQTGSGLPSACSVSAHRRAAVAGFLAET